MISPFTDSDLNEIRTLFTHQTSGITYLNHAAISPFPVSVQKALSYWRDVRANGPVDNFSELEDTVSHTRAILANYIGSASPNQLTFMGNTSDGLSAVANGLDWTEGDEIILNTMEFPSNVHPFRILESKGVRLQFIPHQNFTITPDHIRNSITPNTKLVSISAVQYLSGYRANLEEIGRLCREHNILFVVDGIQALGAAPIDVESCKIDALAAGAHKWLMSPMGIGFLYLSENIQRKMKPVKTGWLSVENPWSLSDFNKPWLPINSHLETGTINIFGVAGLKSSLELFETIGHDDIEKHIQSLTGYIYDRLQDTTGHNISIISPGDPDRRLGIISFRIEGTDSCETVVEQLKKKGITISAREHYFRLSPHFYNTKEEVESALDQLFNILSHTVNE
ncbi:MAG: aminotransferase class V-fold PLP-dependent enzyme [Bacteroidetes bacterium]|jgi:selenocysteine lyase/cysteine desulfurase|nr:aminotransferase class V-fold PLP-dependent enzyme [Bacteroidota bacterium]